MGKIFCLMGKSSTGKDTIYRHLLRKESLHLHSIVPYTTRPIRDDERDGVDYHFIDEEMVTNLEQEGKIIEIRAYNTCHGVWKYMTVNDGNIVDNEDYLFIGTIEVFRAMKEFYGEERIIPLLINLDDGLRLQRALNRERKQADPKYKELCRRFLADDDDFSVEKIEAAGIKESFCNDDLHQCIEEISEFILSHK